MKIYIKKTQVAAIKEVWYLSTLRDGATSEGTTSDNPFCCFVCLCFCFVFVFVCLFGDNIMCLKSSCLSFITRLCSFSGVCLVPFACVTRLPQPPSPPPSFRLLLGNVSLHQPTCASSRPRGKGLTALHRRRPRLRQGVQPQRLRSPTVTPTRKRLQ